MSATPRQSDVAKRQALSIASLHQQLGGPSSSSSRLAPPARTPVALATSPANAASPTGGTSQSTSDTKANGSAAATQAEVDAAAERVHRLIDDELRTLLDGFRDLVSLASLRDKDAARVEQDNLEARVRADRLCHSAASLSLLCASLKLSALLGLSGVTEAARANAGDGGAGRDEEGLDGVVEARTTKREAREDEDDDEHDEEAEAMDVDGSQVDPSQARGEHPLRHRRRRHAPSSAVEVAAGAATLGEERRRLVQATSRARARCATLVVRALGRGDDDGGPGAGSQGGAEADAGPGSRRRRRRRRWVEVAEEATLGADGRPTLGAQPPRRRRRGSTSAQGAQGRASTAHVPMITSASDRASGRAEQAPPPGPTGPPPTAAPAVGTGPPASDAAATGGEGTADPTPSTTTTDAAAAAVPTMMTTSVADGERAAAGEGQAAE